MSRDQIGKLSDYTLIEHFIDKFGPETSDMFRNAQENFIHSMAAYSMVSYFVQIKDRHNANIMIDDTGHLMHIDFGFIFETSPAKNLGFENAEFKLLTDMVNVMGRTPNSDAFMYYREQTIKAGLISKDCYDSVFDIVRLNEASGLFCFLNDQGVTNFQQRFLTELDAFKTAAKVNKMIDGAYDNLRTIIYDKIQYLQNKIMH